MGAQAGEYYACAHMHARSMPEGTALEYSGAASCVCCMARLRGKWDNFEYRTHDEFGWKRCLRRAAAFGWRECLL